MRALNPDSPNVLYMNLDILEGIKGVEKQLRGLPEDKTVTLKWSNATIIVLVGTARAWFAQSADNQAAK